MPRPKRQVHPIIQTLRIERERQRLPRQKLAAKIGYDPSQLYQWEVGKVRPTVYRLADWAEGLGMELAVRRRERPDRPAKTQGLCVSRPAW